MISYLRITRIPYEEPYHVRLTVSASNGRVAGELEIYANAKDLAMVGKALAGFPKCADDECLWELGSENPDDRLAFYFRLRVFPVSPTGRCAVEFRFNNNQSAPEQEITEFCLLADPSELDRLGELFRRFAKLHHRVLEWTLHDGKLQQDV